MTRLVVDQAIRAKLRNLEERLEMCDESGRVLGYFTPAVDQSMYQGVDAPASEEELERSEKESGRPLADILRDLEQRG